MKKKLISKSNQNNKPKLLKRYDYSQNDKKLSNTEIKNIIDQTKKRNIQNAENNPLNLPKDYNNDYDNTHEIYNPADISEIPILEI